jgi:hygromycin-B 4-O-kinase
MDARLRPAFERDQALAALDELWNFPVEDLTPLKDGEVSAAFAFRSDGSEYILRISHRPENFQKDRLVFERLNGTSVPVPAVHLLSAYQDLAVCVSERLPGQLFCDLPVDRQRELAPKLLEVLSAIHHTDVSDTSGYGGWTDWIGPSTSAASEIAETIRDLEAQAAEANDSEMKHALTAARRFLPYVSEERRLLHGDYGFNNVVTDGTSITGVFDWANSAYGDPVKDVAWLNFWQSDIDFGELYEPYLKEPGTGIPHYQERLQLFLYLEVAGSLGFFRSKGSPSGRQFVCSRLAQLQDAGARGIGV